MTAWVAPITFSSGTILTAAQMNAEVRDHAVWLKAALDVLTGSTTADTGTTMYVNVTRTTSTDPVISGRVSGDGTPRFTIDAAGKMVWGAGGAVDTALYRSGAALLNIDTNLLITAGSLLIGEIVAPGGSANQARLFAVDNGAGKTVLKVIFGTGAAVQLAIEP